MEVRRGGRLRGGGGGGKVEGKWMWRGGKVEVDARGNWMEGGSFIHLFIVDQKILHNTLFIGSVTL